MLTRLATLACLICLALGGLATTGPAARASDGSSRHRLFFANAQRQSLTGAASARGRMRRMVHALARSHADLGVLVELQDSQPSFFRADTRDRWGMLATADGVRNSVIYDRSVWTPVERSEIATFWNGGSHSHTPVVVLEDAAGYRVGVIPVHNPRGNGHLSHVNNRRILKAAHALRKAGTPVLIAGDFNSGRGALCSLMSRRHRLESVSHIHVKSCHRGRGGRIDQAFATSGLKLFGYRAAPSRATDHRRVYSFGFRVLLAPEPAQA